jgi:hypothetical protein
VKNAGGTMSGGRKEAALAWAKAFYAVFLRYSQTRVTTTFSKLAFELVWLTFCVYRNEYPTKEM